MGATSSYVGWACLLLFTGCDASAEPGAPAAADAGVTVALDGDATVDSGDLPWDLFSPVDVAGVACPDLPLTFVWPETVACTERPGEVHGRCDAGRGPSIELASFWDGCAAAAAADGHASYEWSGAFVLEAATCEGATLVHVDSGMRAAVRWGGSATVAEVLVNRGPIVAMRAHAWTSSTGCVTSTRVLAAGGSTAVVLSALPPGGGRVPITSTTRLTIGAAATAPARCAAGPGWWCATLEDTAWANSAALPACGTGGVPAPLGGCGDVIGVPITVGETACGDRLEVGLVWPESTVLCH